MSAQRTRGEIVRLAHRGLRAVLVDDSETWGALTLLRERGRPHFSDAEIRCVASVTGPTAGVISAPGRAPA
ncbi:hypothetical protein [Pseudonocardia zijingensis]|uniref:ANTAR domain-containing protein n=1 Tax=Pseudonocardia zijingensis TaxID=153376 RepID=A0ABN1N6Y0_9PSEU